MTPLLLVTGFLGAGKTTFLRALLPALAEVGLRARVVLNDFADARIDTATLSDLAPELVALSGTCVCCEDLDELVATLGATRGAPGDVIVVEANGGTEAGELLALLGGAPELDHLTDPLQLTVVDGKRFGTRGWQNQIEREQLATANYVWLGRRDLIDADRAAAVTAEIERAVPDARFVTPAALAQLLRTLEQAARPQAGRTATRAPQAAHNHDHDHDHAHALSGHFASHVVALPSPVDAAALLAFLVGLPPAVLRAKGIVVLRDPAGEKRSFQKVEREVEISPCQLAEPDTLAPRAVFVGPQLPIALIEAGLAALARA